MRVLLAALAAVDATSLTGKSKPAEGEVARKTVSVAIDERGGDRRRTPGGGTKRGAGSPAARVGTAAKLQSWPPSGNRTLRSKAAAEGHFRNRLAMKALMARV